MKISCINTYSCGRESTTHHDIDDTDLPAYDVATEYFDELWDFLWEYSGDGHPCGEKDNAYYEIEILDAADPALVGLGNEWC